MEASTSVTPYAHLHEVPPTVAQIHVPPTKGPPQQTILSSVISSNIPVVVVQLVQGSSGHPLQTSYIQHHPYNRRFICWLGCPYTELHSPGPMVTQRRKDAYQHLRTASSPVHLPSTSSSCPIQVCTTPLRQRDSGSLYKQARRSQVSVSLPRSNPIMELVPTTQCHTY